MSARPSSAEQALELFLANRQRGDKTSPAAFAERHPEFGAELASALAALVALESATRSPEDEPLPERVGAFRILRRIGRGGMGLVLEAIEEPLGRRVALKLIPAELLASASARERFRREAALAARLDHSAIATIYGAGVDDERPWIAMRFVEGRTLAQEIAAARESGAACAELPGMRGDARAQVLALAACLARVARALHCAHEQGVVHRDLKPSNIIVAPDGSPVLLDFGLAITAELEGDALTRTGETAGTPAYLAPELVGGEHSRPDVQCDVYSLGVTLYECLALRRPFDAPTPAALYLAILASATPDLRAAQRAIPRDLAVVVATAMERDRSRRYRSAAALAADLEACVAGRPIAARPVPLAGRVLRWARREPRQAVLASGLALATIATAVLGGNWWATRDEMLAADALARHNSLEEALEEGFSALSLERDAQAAAAFTHARALEPRSSEALAGLLISGTKSLPAEELQALLAELPRDAPAFDLLTALVRNQPLPASALATSLEGASALDLCLRGLCLIADARRMPFSARGPRQQQALQCFTEAILRAPVARPLYYEQRALAAQVALDTQASRSAASALLELWPESPSALYAAGRALAAIDPPASVRILELSIARAPHRLDSYNMLAMAYCNAGDPKAAEDCSWRALAIDPGSANMIYWLGESMARQNCTAESSIEYLRSVAIDPSSHEAWAKIGLAQFVTGHAAEALPYYARSLAIDPGMDRVRLFYGAAMEAAGDATAGTAELQQALAGLFPQDANFWKQMANIFQYLHAPQSSLIAAEAGLALAPKDADLAMLRANAEKALAEAR